VTFQEGRSAQQDKPWTACVTIPTLAFGQLPARHFAKFPGDLPLLVVGVEAIAGWLGLVWCSRWYWVLS
jgi:hypothetical protein